MIAKRILILTALQFEAKPIARRLALKFISRTVAIGNGEGGVALRLEIIGPRAKFLPALHPGEKFDAVILAGLAGGLAPDLRRGDVVIDEHSDFAETSASRRGKVATVDSIVSTPAEKAELRRSTGALVVDMESAIVRDWARRQGIPYVGLRAVSDTAAETLHPATLRLVDERGFLRLDRLASELIRNPSFAAFLWKFRESRRSTDALANAVSAECKEVSSR